MDLLAFFDSGDARAHRRGVVGDIRRGAGRDGEIHPRDFSRFFVVILAVPARPSGCLSFYEKLLGKAPKTEYSQV